MCKISYLIVLLLLIPASLSAQQVASGKDKSAPTFQWKRYPHNPVFPAIPGTWMESQTANPDLLLIGDTYFMYFRGQQGGHDRIGVATISRKQFDGVTWNIHPEPIIDVGPPGSWDENHCLDPSTVLVDGKVCLYPWNAGLATSRDLVHWKKYAGNPIFSRGEPGSWDEGAIWFTTVEKINGRYYMWYEGYGGGSARTKPYGSYLKGGKSQVGMAILDAPYFYVQPAQAE